MTVIRFGGFPARGAMVWVHPHGGSATCYGLLSEALPKEFACYGISARGADDGLRPRRDLAEMADAYIEEASEAWDVGGALYLGGWSLGGGIALEMATRLRAARGAEPDLVLIEPTGFELVPRDDLEASRDNLERLAALLALASDATPPPHEEQQVVVELMDRVGIPLSFLSLGWDGLAAEVELQSSHFVALVSHHPRAVPNRTLLVASEDLAASDRWDRYLAAWRRLTPNLKTELVGGEHETLLLSASSSRAIAAAVTRWLETSTLRPGQ